MTDSASMATEPRPMDPEWLDQIRRGLDSRQVAVDALLADRDYQEKRADEWERKAVAVGADALAETVRLKAEITRLRSRVRVEVEDVERAGVTRAHVEAWLLANGWTMESKANTFAGSSWSAPQVKRGGYLRGGFVELPAAEENATDRLLLAGDINTIAKYAERHGLDILDEMAATEVPK